VTIAAGDNAFEGGAASDFTISLNHASLVDLRINLSAASRGAAGRNYVRLPRYVTILAGEMSAEVALTPLVDGVAKGDIAVKEKVVGGRGYTIGTARSGVVTIVDDEPKISFTATNASTQLGGTAGQITIASSGLFGSDLILTLVIRGSARNGRDYLLLSKTVTIPAGSSSTAIDIVPLLNPARAKTVTLSCKVNNLIFSLSPLAKSALVSILHV
jgi:hypothetical protein